MMSLLLCAGLDEFHAHSSTHRQPLIYTKKLRLLYRSHNGGAGVVSGDGEFCHIRLTGIFLKMSQHQF